MFDVCMFSLNLMLVLTTINGIETLLGVVKHCVEQQE